MSDIVVSKKDEVHLIVKPNDSGIIMELSEFFTFYVPGYKFVPSYRNKMWDGKIRLYNTRDYTLPSGLLYHLTKFVETRGYTMDVPNNLVKKLFGSDRSPEFLQWLNGTEHLNLNLHVNGKPAEARDYQIDAIHHVLKYQKALLLSPTGSCKSLIIYALTQHVLNNIGSRCLIIVPTTSLVEQMFKDFLDYGGTNPHGTRGHIITEKDIHRIYSGKEKNNYDARITITTWQSVYKLPESWFEKFGVVVGDEAHLFKAKSLTTVMGKLKNAWMRVGTTGTLDGTKVHKLVLEGCFGPVYNVTSTKKLIESKTLSDVSIDVLHMQYSDAEKKAFGKKTYQEEISYIVQHEQRNKFIRNLALAQKGNTLVLFNLVETHGKPLFNSIKDKAGNDRKVFYVSGEIKTEEREAIREATEKENNAIIVASIGTFSTGINIRNLHNLIFSSPTKSQVRVLQSLGRSLRKADNGQPAKVYDLCDDFSWKTRKNYTLGHGIERIEIYEKEQLNFKTHPVPMPQDKTS